MATIQPFCALRFTHKAGNMSELACPPYDIISEEQRQEYLARNPYNIIRLELPREGDNPYKTAGDTFSNWMQAQVLESDQQPAFYIYEEVFDLCGEQKSIKGIICRVKLEEFSQGIVLPHEETLSKAKDDRFQLMCATGCNFSSIYSLYFDKEQAIYPNIERLSLQAPDTEFIGADGIEHRVWNVTDPQQIEKLVAAFADKKLYIADGHHRYETGLRYKKHLQEQGILTDDTHPGNYIMMTLLHMEHEGLVVQPTHRIVRDLQDWDCAKLLEGCSQYFAITDTDSVQGEAAIAKAAAQNQKAMVLYIQGQWKLLTLRDADVMNTLLPDKSNAYRRLDVSILHTLVLERLLGIDKQNMANQKNLIYTRDISEAVVAVDNGEANCAFIIGATGVEEIAAVAGAGEKMPQKSTYFYPKLITGHVMNKILDELY